MKFEELKETILFKDAEEDIMLNISHIKGLLNELKSLIDDKNIYLEIAKDSKIRMCTNNTFSNSICLKSD